MIKLSQLLKEIKIHSPQKIEQEISDLFSDILNKIWEIEDSITQINYELVLVDIIKDMFPEQDVDSLFPEDWMEMLGDLESGDLKIILSKLKKLDLDIE